MIVHPVATPGRNVLSWTVLGDDDSGGCSTLLSAAVDVGGTDVVFGESRSARDVLARLRDSRCMEASSSNFWTGHPSALTL